MHHVEGYTDLEWPIDARNRRNALCACFSHAQTRPEITPYPKSAHNGTSNSARNSGCATDRSPIKMHHLERYTGLEWHDHAKTAAARSTHVLEHAQAHHGIPLHTKDARNSTSDSARNSRARHPARPSKCTISSTVRARSGTPTHIIIYIYHI